MKIKPRCLKVCKKKNLSCVIDMDRQICPSSHRLASRAEPCDAKESLRTDLSIHT